MLNKIIEKYGISAHVRRRTKDFLLVCGIKDSRYFLLFVYPEKIVIYRIPKFKISTLFGTIHSLQQLSNSIIRADVDLQPYEVETVSLEEKQVVRKKRKKKSEATETPDEDVVDTGLD